MARNPLPRAARALLYTALAAPAGLGLYAYKETLRLERAYPATPPPPSSPLSTPSASGTDWYAPHRPVYSPQGEATAFFARVPSALLPREPRAAARAWADACLRSRLMRWEGDVVSRAAGKGDSAGPAPRWEAGEQVVGGALTVVHPPDERGHALYKWRMAPEPVAFFERIARWGYPWRLMEGGRHETSVQRTEDPETVLVGFSAGHDYHVNGGDGKVIPQWVERAHRAYGRLVLEEGVKELYRRAGKEPPK
ncbi:hypothetical protein HDZ31DRAFT_83421 [Schizophyllum fasciatum]